MYVCYVFMSVCVLCVFCPWRTEVFRLPKTGCILPCGDGELKLGPLGENSVLRIAEPSFTFKSIYRDLHASKYMNILNLYLCL